MIPKYDGYKAEKMGGTSAKLPVGNYVAKIMKAEVNAGQLIISFDISEGEHKDFFTNDWKSNTRDDKKWRGTTRLFIPTANDERNAFSIRQMNNLAACLEESNAGYRWDWDESKLKNKLIGLMYQEQTKPINGKMVTFTACGGICTVEAARDPNTATLKPYIAKGAQNATTAYSAPAQDADDDDDIPF